MDDAATTSEGNPRLALLLGMAMFVLVVDTSIMNVSISAVVHDLDTTVSGVQGAIALEALVSAAFILIGSKVGDLIGRKRAYVLGLLGYAIGALAMTLAQNLTAVIVFWAVIGGIGASLLLPAMQSLIHGNFEGDARRSASTRKSARPPRSRPRSVRCSAASSPPTCPGGSAFLLEARVIAVVLSGIKLVRDVPYTGIRGSRPRRRRPVHRRHGRRRARHPRVAGRRRIRRARCSAVGVVALARPRVLAGQAQARGQPTLLDPDLFRSKLFRLGITGQMLQQIALGGTMIVLPIFLQMVLEYNAMQAGLSIAPLSLSMFAVALLAGRRAGTRRPSGDHPRRVRAGRDRRRAC